jgi:hypothetical protein
MGQMRTRPPGFAICEQKGFHVTFENGWTVSVQFGGGNYSDNYDHRIGPGPVPHSATAEVAAWPNGGEMIRLDCGDTVAGWQTPAQVLALMVDIAARPAGAAA